MVGSGFISEIRNYKTVKLGNTEENLLNIIASHEYSAWDVTKILEQSKQRIAYKNVRETLVRLRALGLVERLKKRSESEHNVKPYKITSRGIFQLMLARNFFPYELNRYSENIITQNILYRFFETSSIKKFGTIPRLFALRQYLAKCCQTILKKLELLRSLRRDGDLDYLSLEIEESITIEIKNFVYQIITGSKIKDSQTLYDYSHPILLNQRYEEDTEENESGPNYRSLFPKPALMADKKFMKVLGNMKKEFDNGCKDYLGQKNRIT